MATLFAFHLIHIHLQLHDLSSFRFFSNVTFDRIQKNTSYYFPVKKRESRLSPLFTPFSVTDGRDGCPQVPAGGFASIFPRRLADIFCRIFLHSPPLTATSLQALCQHWSHTPPPLVTQHLFFFHKYTIKICLQIITAAEVLRNHQTEK